MRQIPLSQNTFFRTTRARLLLVVLLVFIPTLGLQVYEALSDLGVNVERQKQASVQVIAHAQSDFEDLIETARAVFAGLAGVNELHQPNTCNDVITAMRLAYERLMPQVTDIGLADGQGNIYCTIKPTQGTRNIAGQIDFQTALQTLDLALGMYTGRSVDGSPSMSVTYPVLSTQGNVQTMLFLTTDTTWLEDWQSNAALPPDATVTLFAPDGEVLWRSVNGKKVPVEGLTNQQVSWYASLQASSQETIEGQDFDGVVRLHALVPLKLNDQVSAWLHLGYPINPLYEEAYTLLGWKLGFLTALALVVLLLAWWGSEVMFLRPLSNLMGVVKRVQGGDLGVRVSRLNGLGELTELASSFDQMTDALQRREIERRQLEERFRAIYENAAIGISLIAPDGEILAVNPTLIEMSGYSESELKTLRGRGITYPEDIEVGQAEFGEVINGTRQAYSIEKRYVHKDGRIHWMRQTISPARDTAGKLLYLVVVAEDIDRQKRAVEELRESEARFRAILDNTAVGIAVMTLDRRIVQINQAAVRITGYSSDEIAAINPSMLAIEEDRYLDRELFAELVKGQRNQYLVEKRYYRKDGTIFWGRVNFALVHGPDNQPLYTIGMIEDITEEKGAAERLAAQESEYRRILEERITERTEELNLANEQLREKAALDAVTAERTRLARDLHDAVTQTLFSTTLIADVLPELWEMNQAEGRKRLEELRLLTRGALAEMRTLLVELRPNALVEAPLPSLLRQLVEALVGRSRINIQLSAEEDFSGNSTGSATSARKLPADVQVGLYRIAQEALNNVVKHARASEAVVTLRIGDVVRLTVADNGKGFDPALVTADHLGLKIMRERAEAIGAKLSIYSEPGEGTQISILWQGKLETR